MDIEFVGPAIIEQMYKKRLIRSAVDLYKLSMDDLMKLDLVKEKSAQNLYSAIQASKHRPLKRLLTAFCIKNVGKETADILANEFGTIERLKEATVEELAAINGVGAKMAVEIHEFFHNRKTLYMLNKLKELGVEPAPQEMPKSDILKGKTFVLTGTLQNMTRDEASEKIKMYGGKTSSSVSKNTSYVLVGANPGSKLDKAKNLGVIILTEEEFLEMIKGQE